jgi:hypothetical protein
MDKFALVEIPAQAGIQLFPARVTPDPRFRGDFGEVIA